MPDRHFTTINFFVYTEALFNYAGIDDHNIILALLVKVANTFFEIGEPLLVILRVVFETCSFEAHTLTV